MIDGLLKYYNKELSYIRRSAVEFSKRYPKVASRLRLGEDSVEDPHVGRLIESVAYMNARISKKLDDDFSELTESILSTLYPHYLAPIPSMSIVQFLQTDSLSEASKINKGTEIKTQEIDGEACYFRTTSDIELLPISVTDANFMGGAFVAPNDVQCRDAKSVLRLVLQCQQEKSTFQELSPNKIRFYLKGESSQVNQIYALLFNQLNAVAIADNANDSQALFLDNKTIQQVGYNTEDGMLPYSSRSFLGYRLLTEYFVFPQKFLFFEIADLDVQTFLDRGQKIELFLYFNQDAHDLERSVSADTFALGCTPVVNLFKQQAEAVRMNHQSEEYHISADISRPLSKEIYSIDSVIASSHSEKPIEYKAFYSFDHNHKNQQSVYWHTTRRPPEQNSEERLDAGTEIYMSLVDLGFQSVHKDGWTLSTEITCLNRDLPERLPFGGGQPLLSLVNNHVAISSIKCLTAPSRTRRLYADDELRWRLVSHLNLNYSSIFESSDSAATLKEMLKLYNFDDSPSSNALIEGILDIKSRQVLSRVNGSDSIGGICRGLEITVYVDENRYESNGLFLFGNVLERFFALFAPINSFTRLILTSTNREVPIKKWPSRAGEKQLA